MTPSGEGPAESSTALALYRAPTLRGRALAFAELAPDQRRREAAAAAASHDAGGLVELTIAYLLVRGRQHEAASDHTLRSYAAGVRALLRAWTSENLLHPSADAGDRFMSALSADHAPATCAARLAAASALYRALAWCKATTAEPFAGVAAPRDRTPRHERRRPYTDEQVASIVAAADDRLITIILLTAHGGLRIAEALALRWRDWSADNATLRVRSGKGRKARTVHVSGSLRAALDRAAAKHYAWDGAIVEREDGAPAIDASWLRRRLALAAAAAGVPYLGWHAFRHTAGTRLARETGNLQLVAAHLGHADVSTAAIYAKWSDSQLAAQVAAW